MIPVYNRRNEMKKQDFIDYQKQNNLTITELARKIGLHPRTLWMFLYSNSKRRRDVMYKLKDFYNEYIAAGKQLELLDPVKNEEIEEEVKEETPIEQEEIKEEYEDDDCCCEECVGSISFREFMIGIRTALLTLKYQGSITQDTLDGLDVFLSGIEEKYNEALLENE